MKIDIIPVGRENRKTKQQLMLMAKIFDEKIFRKEIAKLRKDNIIVRETDGYYIPDTKEDLQGIIKKYNQQKKDMTRIINLAYEMLEKMGE